MSKPIRSRQLIGLILITIGLALISITIAQSNRSAPPITPTVIVQQTSPIATATLPALEPTAIETPTPRPVMNPVPTSENSRTPTLVSNLIPTKIISTLAPKPTATSEPTKITLPIGSYTTRQRIGVGVGNGERTNGTLRQLNAGFYLTWGLRPIADAPPDADYWPMIRIFNGQPRIDLAVYTQYAHDHPGLLWLIGNEPDVIWQDKSTPEEYATIYHTAYTELKAADPSSRIAIGGVSQPTPLRMQYLDRVLAAYQDQFSEPMPIDVWNIHNFILNEQHDSWGIDIPPGLNVITGTLHTIDEHDDFAIFKQQIIDFRTWMAAHGYRDKELIVSEYGILMPPDYGFDHTRVRDFMLRSFDYFSTAADKSIGLPSDTNRLVQRWCWFSLSDNGYVAGNLVDYDSGAITLLGQDFINYLQSH